MTRRDRTLLLGLAVLTPALAALTLVGLSPDILLAVPALVLALLLLSGRYVGEEGIARLAAAYRASRPPRAVASLAPAARRAARPLPRGGSLIAAALAVRPPPAPLRFTA